MHTNRLQSVDTYLLKRMFGWLGRGEHTHFCKRVSKLCKLPVCKSGDVCKLSRIIFWGERISNFNRLANLSQNYEMFLATEASRTYTPLSFQFRTGTYRYLYPGAWKVNFFKKHLILLAGQCLKSNWLLLLRTRRGVGDSCPPATEVHIYQMRRGGKEERLFPKNG